MRGPDGKIVPATFNPEERAGLLHKTASASNGLEDSVFTISTALGDQTSEILPALAPNTTVRNSGSSEALDHLRITSLAGGGNNWTNPKEFFPTPEEHAEAVAAAQGIVAAKATNSAGEETSVIANVMSGTRAARESAQAATTLALPSPVALQAANNVENAMVQFAMAIETPEFAIYVASLDPKFIGQVVAAIQEDFRTSEIQVAANYNEHLYRNNIPVMFAANGDKFPANMKGMLASVGVDKNSMLPVGGELKVAGLAPILNMAQLDPIEPAQLQLALRDSVDSITTVAQNQPIKAIINAMPIAAVAH